AVIIVESCMLRLAGRQRERGGPLATAERLEVVRAATREVALPSIVSVLVVVLVNLPILALAGVEGKMFRPMAFAVVTALLGALVLSLTFVPAAVALLLRGPVRAPEHGLARLARRGYAPLLALALAYRRATLAL